MYHNRYLICLYKFFRQFLRCTEHNFINILEKKVRKK